MFTRFCSDINRFYVLVLVEHNWKVLHRFLCRSILCSSTWIPYPFSGCDRQRCDLLCRHLQKMWPHCVNIVHWLNSVPNNRHHRHQQQQRQMDYEPYLQLLLWHFERNQEWYCSTQTPWKTLLWFPILGLPGRHFDTKWSCQFTRVVSLYQNYGAHHNMMAPPIKMQQMDVTRMTALSSLMFACFAS